MISKPNYFWRNIKPLETKLLAAVQIGVRRVRSTRLWLEAGSLRNERVLPDNNALYFQTFSVDQIV